MNKKSFCVFLGIFLALAIVLVTADVGETPYSIVSVTSQSADDNPDNDVSADANFGGGGKPLSRTVTDLMQVSIPLRIRWYPMTLDRQIQCSILNDVPR